MLSTHKQLFQCVVARSRGQSRYIFLTKASLILLFYRFALTLLVFKLHFFKMEAQNSFKVVFGAYDLPFYLMKQPNMMSVWVPRVSTVKMDSGMTQQL